jgi:putative glutathione S-transferase
MPAPAATCLEETAATGAFQRSASTLTGRLGTAGNPVVGGRWVLYVAFGCPWACRVLAALALKGLEQHVRVVVVCPTWQRTRPEDPADTHRGWVFRARAAPGSPDAAMLEVPLVDPVFGVETLRAVYDSACDPETRATVTKFTVPLLVDADARRAVCNESSLMLRDFGGPLFNALAQFPGIDLFPQHLAPEIELANDRMYEALNNGVYKCGFAQSQPAYDAAAAALAAAFDEFDTRLAKSRSGFLCGDQLTEADIRLFVTLVRFDPVYVMHFKCGFRSVRARPALLAFMRRVFAARGGPGGRSVGEASVRLDHIKQHYYASHPLINPFAIIPRAYPDEGSELQHAT